MTTLWEFEAAEPEVGFLSDTITHACRANVEGDAQPATITDTRHVDQPCGKLVNSITTISCPACGATTAYVEQWPAWMFEEDRSEDER